MNFIIIRALYLTSTLIQIFKAEVVMRKTILKQKCGTSNPRKSGHVPDNFRVEIESKIRCPKRAGLLYHARWMTDRFEQTKIILCP